MYPAPFRYHRAGSVAEAVGMLSDIGEGARALAGGQSLLVLMKLRFEEPSDLVDLGRIPGLYYITPPNAEVNIGALATHGHGAGFSLAATDNRHVRHLLSFRLADLVVQGP